MSYKKVWEIGSFKVDAPNERSLQILYAPQVDKNIKDVTVLMSTLFPHQGKTGLHTHTVDEIIYVMNGRDEGQEGDRIFQIEPGIVMYIPAGVEHDCRNFSDETMRMLCIYVPSLPEDKAKNILVGAKIRGKQR